MQKYPTSKIDPSVVKFFLGLVVMKEHSFFCGLKRREHNMLSNATGCRPHFYQSKNVAIFLVMNPHLQSDLLSNNLARYDNQVTLI